MTRFIALLFFAGLAAAACGAAGAAAPTRCSRRPATAPAMARLEQALRDGRFIAYQPTALAVVDGRVTPADPASIRADLAVLRPAFDSLITYDAIHGAENIPEIAVSLKFRALIIGVWDPRNETELRAVSAAVRRFPRLIVGVSLGNELLFSRRSDPAALGAAIARARALLPHTPVSTSEPFHVFYEDSATPLLAQLDFLLANVHPVFQPWFRAAPDSAGAQFVVNVVGRLATSYCGPILVKETGVPTAPASGAFSEARQASFYRELRQLFPSTRTRAFSYFSAFDAPWRSADATGVPGAHPEEAYWGLYDAMRRPKAAGRELPPLTSPPVPP